MCFSGGRTGVSDVPTGASADRLWGGKGACVRLRLTPLPLRLRLHLPCIAPSVARIILSVLFRVPPSHHACLPSQCGSWFHQLPNRCTPSPACMPPCTPTRASWAFFHHTVAACKWESKHELRHSSLLLRPCKLVPIHKHGVHSPQFGAGLLPHE